MKVRKSVYELTDDTLLWYSRAVDAMKAKDINDPTSWWYQAGVHGYPTNPQIDNFWNIATGFPPSQQTLDSGYWEQCQHGTWFFLPWHRMYLYYFEAIVARTIVDLGGPVDWTLPYWNYCEALDSSVPPAQQQRALNIPSEFGSNAGPNQEYPGLWLEGRRNYTLLIKNVDPWRALNEAEFTNAGNNLNFGGGVTGFSHFSNRAGQLEFLPHNVVHGNIGGAMGDPDTAGLDPIFWLHHANIDRLWQVWLDAGHANPDDDSRWTDFPFHFHDAQGNEVSLDVSQVETTAQLGYSYSPGYPASAQIIVPTLFAAKTLKPTDIIGATLQTRFADTLGTNIQLEMVPKAFREATLDALQQATVAPKKTILHIDNVTGNGTTAPLDVFIGSDPATGKFAGSVGLFGLKQASKADLKHDGSGLNIALDVSEIIDQLRLQPDWDEENISVQFVPQFDHGGTTDINIGRVSLESEVDG